MKTRSSVLPLKIAGCQDKSVCQYGEDIIRLVMLSRNLNPSVMVSLVSPGPPSSNWNEWQCQPFYNRRCMGNLSLGKALTHPLKHSSDATSIPTSAPIQPDRAMRAAISSDMPTGLTLAYHLILTSLLIISSQMVQACLWEN